MEKRKVGRPKLPEGERLSKAYFLRFREGEFEKLKALAAKNDLSVAEFVRKVIFEKKEV